jgi:hypothetical protein
MPSGLLEHEKRRYVLTESIVHFAFILQAHLPWERATSLDVVEIDSSLAHDYVIHPH